MRNEQTENDKRTQARNLYLQSNLTQAEIARIVGLSQKTICQYINRHKWKEVKENAQQMPAIFIEQMNCELKAINDAIAARSEGNRFPTMAEAEVRRKILYSMASIKERQSVASHMEVIIDFIAIVANQNTEHARIISEYAMNHFTEAIKNPRAPHNAEYNIPDEGEETEEPETP